MSLAEDSPIIPSKSLSLSNWRRSIITAITAVAKAPLMIEAIAIPWEAMVDKVKSKIAARIIVSTHWDLGILSWCRATKCFLLICASWSPMPILPKAAFSVMVNFGCRPHLPKADSKKLWLRFCA